MDSREVYHEVTAVRPELQTLVVTGYPVTPELREAFPESKALWLQKPFSRLELLARVELLWGAACRAT
jgi:response regulator RpfG family c-di-GMP phosphodiesterase